MAAVSIEAGEVPDEGERIWLEGCGCVPADEGPLVASGRVRTVALGRVSSSRARGIRPTVSGPRLFRYKFF